MLTAYEVEERFLGITGRFDPIIQAIHEAYARVAADKFADVRRTLGYAATAYLLTLRREVIEEYCTAEYGGVLAAPPDFDQIVNPTRETIMELNAIQAFYQADRFIIHVYLDAHLTKVVSGYPEIVDDLDTLVRDLKTGTA